MGATMIYANNMITYRGVYLQTELKFHDESLHGYIVVYRKVATHK